MSSYRAASPNSSIDAEWEVDDIVCGGPYQYFDHEVMSQWAADSANNPAQTEKDLEDNLRRFLGQYEEDRPHASTTAQAHASATTPATMVAPVTPMSSTAAFTYSSHEGQYQDCQLSHSERDLQAYENDLQAREENLQAQRQAHTEIMKAWELHVGDMKRSRENELRGSAEKLEVREHFVRKREKAIVKREQRLVRTCLQYKTAYKTMARQCEILDAIIAEQDADKAKEKELTVEQLEDELLKRVRLPK